MLENFISIQEACNLLAISRPTFDKKREKLHLKEVALKGRVRFLKSEILSKIYADYPLSAEPVDLVLTENSQLTQIQIDETTFDLRRINSIDPYGAISLLCAVIGIASKGRVVNLVVDKSDISKHLKAIGFFDEIERRYKKMVFWNKPLIKKLNSSNSEAILPFKYVAYKGSERKIAEDLVKHLTSQGFSSTVGSYIGWIFGELADNALTHARGPCYLMVNRFEDEHKYLSIAVGDIGVGIHNSLKQNPKYKDLDNKKALLMAFKTRTSSWDDTHERGKGLADVLKIAVGNKSFFRVDSCELGLFMNFSDYKRKIEFKEPMTQVSGTRFCLILVDDEFQNIPREETDKIIDKALRVA